MLEELPIPLYMKVGGVCGASLDVGTGILHFGDVCKFLHGVQIKICCATPTALPSWYNFFGFSFDNIDRVIPYLLDVWKGNY